MPAAPSGPLDARIELGVGRSAWIPDTSFQLRFVAVVSDTRCPANALCVWAGDALVRIDITQPARDRFSYDLHMFNSQPVRHADVTIALLGLSPYPYAGQAIRPEDYRATFRVAR
jgi:hypothetical protein